MHELAPGRHHPHRAPLLGLPTLPYVDLPRPQITTSHPPNGYLWKRDHVDAWLGDAPPVVWIDDDFTGLDHEWAAERSARGVATLLVQPDPHLGLQPEHPTDVTRTSRLSTHSVLSAETGMISRMIRLLPPAPCRRVIGAVVEVVG